jgi:hypothetical protein
LDRSCEAKSEILAHAAAAPISVIVMLPQLTIFDNLQYKVDGNKVTLTGQVTNPVLRTPPRSGQED